MWVPDTKIGWPTVGGNTLQSLVSHQDCEWVCRQSVLARSAEKARKQTMARGCGHEDPDARQTTASEDRSGGT
jgi:hypothetical protein